MFLDKETVDYIIADNVERNYATWNDLYELFTTRLLHSIVVPVLLLVLVGCTLYQSIQNTIDYVSIMKLEQHPGKGKQLAMVIISWIVFLLTVTLLAAYCYNRYLMYLLDSAVPIAELTDKQKEEGRAEKQLLDVLVANK